MVESSLAGFAISAALLGIGIGILVTQTFDLIGEGLPADRVATFSALAYVLRMVGNAFGGLVIGIIAGSPGGDAFKWGLGAATVSMLIPLLASFALVGQVRKTGAPAMS
jgi:dipeptide/tripeptide permease